MSVISPTYYTNVVRCASEQTVGQQSLRTTKQHAKLLTVWHAQSKLFQQFYKLIFTEKKKKNTKVATRIFYEN